MNKLKHYIILTALVCALGGAAGCTNIKDLVAKPVPTNTPTPTPTRSADLWVTATPHAGTENGATPTQSVFITATPTPVVYTPETPTPAYIQITATPTQKPVATPTKAPVISTPTNTPKSTPKNTPTTAPKKTPTPTPAKGGYSASQLMNILYDALPDMMATTSIKVDLMETLSDGDVVNMYYTKYTNEESLDNNLHAQHDIWLTSKTKDTYSCDEVYTTINSNNAITYTNTSENASNWRKKSASVDSVRKGVTIVPKNSFIGLMNPVIKSSDSSTYVIEMDCAVDITDIITALTDGAYTRRFNKTFKGTATIDAKTLKPINFNVEAENINIANSLVLNYYQMLVDNILDTTMDISVPDEVRKSAY